VIFSNFSSPGVFIAPAKRKRWNQPELNGSADIFVSAPRALFSRLINRNESILKGFIFLGTEIFFVAVAL